MRDLQPDAFTPTASQFSGPPALPSMTKGRSDAIFAPERPWPEPGKPAS